MTRAGYARDIENKEWRKIERIVSVCYEKGGGPPRYSKREILNAIFYVMRTGCQWRYLPHDFPQWTAIYKQFQRWKREGVIERMNDELTRSSRLDIGRKKSPSACIVDSQSVKTTEKGGSKAMMDARK